MPRKDSGSGFVTPFAERPCTCELCHPRRTYDDDEYKALDDQVRGQRGDMERDAWDGSVIPWRGVR